MQTDGSILEELFPELSIIFFDCSIQLFVYSEQLCEHLLLSGGVCLDYGPSEEMGQCHHLSIEFVKNDSPFPLQLEDRFDGVGDYFPDHLIAPERLFEDQLNNFNHQIIVVGVGTMPQNKEVALREMVGQESRQIHREDLVGKSQITDIVSLAVYLLLAGVERAVASLVAGEVQDVLYLEHGVRMTRYLEQELV